MENAETKKDKRRPFPYFLTLVMLLVLGVAYYWYEYRPSIVRQECHQYADKLSKTEENRNDKSRYDFRYKFCLSEKGIK